MALDYDLGESEPEVEDTAEAAFAALKAEVVARLDRLALEMKAVDAGVILPRTAV